MVKIKAFLQVIRLRNLAIILLIQSLIWLLVLRPFINVLDLQASLNYWSVCLLMLSTISIAAAGYIINDYFDVKIDLINKPDKVIIGKIISPRGAIFLHSALNAIGIALVVYVAMDVKAYQLILIPVTSTLLLWLYATDYKGSYIYGNLIVAFLTVLSIMMIPLFETSLWQYFSWDLWIEDSFLNPWFIIGVYSFFAFLLTWIREIVKDMEDYKGDFQQGCQTLPIKFGLKVATQFSQILLTISLVVILISISKLAFSPWWILGLYLFIFICPSLIYLLWKLPKGVSSKHYYNLSQLLKLVMVLGILALVVLFTLFYNV